MKKVLLGTTALVSAGFAAQTAQAADPIELSIGGYHNWLVFYADNDSNPATGHCRPSLVLTLAITT